jgi:hypothetical protein
MLKPLVTPFILLGLLTPVAAWASHPAEGQQSLPLAGEYAAGNNDRTPDWDFGEIRMTDIKPDPATLSDMERYMVAGTATSTLPNGLGLLPWKQEIWSAVVNYYDTFGTVPTELNPQVLRQIPGLANASDEFLQIYSNPLTGAWPRMDASTQSPGDVFIRPLTETEMRYYGTRSRTYWQEWFNGTDLHHRKRRLDGKVWYVRVYGLHGVLCEQFYWMMEEY